MTAPAAARRAVTPTVTPAVTQTAARTVTRTAVAGNRAVVQVDAYGANENSNRLTAADVHAVAAAVRLARTRKLPLVLRSTVAGVDPGSGMDALHGWGSIAGEMARCSGVVPTIAITTGPNVSGTSLILGMADFVIMTADSYAFVAGPRIVERFTGVSVSRRELGGPNVHSIHSGITSFLADDMEEADEITTELLGYISDHNNTDPPVRICDDPVSRPTPEAFSILPENPSGSYDVRDVICAVVDDGVLLEPCASWADNLVTAFASIGGRSVGVVANQPRSKAGAIDIAASRKGARFVAFCDAFNLPLVTFVDTSGFYPGKDLEWRGMIRYGAQMAFAYARATVPRVSVTLRKSYGGAYIVMDSKAMGNDIALAWPSAEIAVMGARGAVGILHRSVSPEEKERQEAAYEQQFLNPYLAAERGAVDAVIDPADTRREIHASLELLSAKRERLPQRRHDNTPL